MEVQKLSENLSLGLYLHFGGLIWIGLLALRMEDQISVSNNQSQKSRQSRFIVKNTTGEITNLWFICSIVKSNPIRYFSTLTGMTIRNSKNVIERLQFVEKNLSHTFKARGSNQKNPTES
jgi:hypothetical protein